MSSDQMHEELCPTGSRKERELKKHPGHAMAYGAGPRAVSAPPINTRWPHAYYCSEHTLDIDIPTSQRKIRIWFNPSRGDWSPAAFVVLAKGLRANPEFRTCPMEVVLDWVATLNGVNAVQVTDQLQGYRVGVMSYLVPFEEDSRITKVVKSTVERLVSFMAPSRRK